MKTRPLPRPRPLRRAPDPRRVFRRFVRVLEKLAPPPPSAAAPFGASTSFAPDVPREKP